MSEIFQLLKNSSAYKQITVDLDLIDSVGSRVISKPCFQIDKNHFSFLHIWVLAEAYHLVLGEILLVLAKYWSCVRLCLH